LQQDGISPPRASLLQARHRPVIRAEG
jgi:hypothetical protein